MENTTTTTRTTSKISESSSFYDKSGLKAYVREGTDDFQLLFMPREEEIYPHLRMNSGETFVDVGANVGYYTLMTALENLENDVDVISIEAHPDTYVALLKNIECNNLEKKITAINKAVADKKQDMAMYEICTTDGVKMFGNSSICLALDSEQSTTVQCDTLDNILAHRKVDVLKMDIEGAEVMALAGSSRVLRDLRKIVVEIHDDNLAAVQSLLEGNGFEITVIQCKLNAYVIGTKPPQTGHNNND